MHFPGTPPTVTKKALVCRQFVKQLFYDIFIITKKSRAAGDFGNL
ncbi:hypothetical protein HMPREF0495_02620 [Levilactobacillus brevis ATCC 14869 = DSM 20054]|uniref:Uncharacterized protein n=1 Tax=Levilactobacillus brevis ATCC 14869 = DSM 20054 TaxID=649758 RepID=U2NRU6_LEVBR|nr:hypothetical protein HMPREF0495_02620 [Levilactobacillus brevis ATCC 14869 = DSM 20054]